MATKMSGVRKKKAPVDLADFTSMTRAYINRIESLWSTLPIVMREIESKQARETQEVANYFEKYGRKRGKTITMALTGTPAINFRKLRKSYTQTSIAVRTIPKSLLVAMVIEFDAFIHALIKRIFLLVPPLADASKKEITLAELMEYESLKEARASIIEREIDGVLRESSLVQLEWFEKRGVMIIDKIKKGDFLEIMERRNLFVHADARINKTYINNCKKYGVDLPPDIKIGVGLGADKDYYQRAALTLLEVGIKLSQLVWRKFGKKRLEEADIQLIETSLDFIRNENYGLALVCLNFGLDSCTPHFDDNATYTLLVNKIQALKWSAQIDEAKKIIEATDWSALNNKFQLAKSVLLDNFLDAAQLMRAAKADGIQKDDYKDWPLFREFIKSERFKKEYKKIYKERFVDESQSPPPAPISVPGTKGTG